MNDNDLKPCPFCGKSKAYIVYNIEMEPDGITCPACHIVVRFPRIKVKGGEKFEVAMKQMAEAWNRRACDVPSAQPELIRCKHCKHWKVGTENTGCPNPMVCGMHSFMHGFERASLPEDYCSWAERRTDD